MKPYKLLSLEEHKCPKCGGKMKEINMSVGNMYKREKAFICEPCTIADSVMDLPEGHNPIQIDLFTKI